MAKLDMMNSGWSYKLDQPSSVGGGSFSGSSTGSSRLPIRSLSGPPPLPASLGPSPICYNYTGSPGGADVMNQISGICDGVYLSGARAVKVARIRELGITSIFNVTIELPSLLIDKIDYVKIAIDDSPWANLSYYFDRVADKIEETRRKGGNTLVHCVAGVSRSASCCIAYLIKYKRLSLRKAYQHVKMRRHCVRPNPGFFRQLAEFEMKHLGSASVQMVWSPAAGCHIPDLYENEYERTMNFLQKYGPTSLEQKYGRCTSDRRH